MSDRSNPPNDAAPAGPPPAVSVIVPHYQDTVRLDRCLTALTQQTFPAESFEIIVADNNSPMGLDKVAEAIAGRARLTLVREKGAGMARNGAVRLARGEILAFTDSDCVPEGDWLAEGVKALPGYDLIGGRMTVLVDDPNAMTPEEAFERVYAFDNEHYVKNRGFTVTANLFCRRSVFDKVGEFQGADVAEDAEWCLRAKSMGFRIGYAAKSVVGHPARRTWAELLGKWRRVNTDNFGLAIRARGGRLRWFLRTFLLPLSAVLHTPQACVSDGVHTLGQRLAAIGVLYRLRFWRIGHSFQLLLKPGTR